MVSGVTRRFSRRRFVNEVLNWVFPSSEQLCILCGRPVVNLSQKGSKIATSSVDEQTFGMCLFCLQDASACKVEPAEQQLRIPRTQGTFDVYSCLPYDHFLRTLIRSWKYDGVIELTRWFASVLSTAWEPELSDAFDCVVPVPSTQDRTEKRGYDHVRLLTETFADTQGLRLLPAIYRQQISSDGFDGFTQSQTAKSAVDRLRQLDGVYQVNKQISVRRRRVLLVDDIVTTGSTLVHCATQLHLAGAKDVSGFVIARVL